MKIKVDSREIDVERLEDRDSELSLVARYLIDDELASILQAGPKITVEDSATSEVIFSANTNGVAEIRKTLTDDGEYTFVRFL